MNRIIIDYWSDYVCPFCYIGMRYLKTAVRELNMEDRVRLEMKSFELDRYAPKTAVFTAAEHFASKYGIIPEKAREQVDRISEKGKQAGISGMDYAGTKTTNTLAAHRLTKYAAEKGHDIQDALQEAIYHAFFCEHLNIGDAEVLKKLAVLQGLTAAEAEEVLSSKQYVKQVREDEKEAAGRGIHMVPHFLINGEIEVLGSASTGEFIKLLQSLT